MWDNTPTWSDKYRSELLTGFVTVKSTLANDGNPVPWKGDAGVNRPGDPAGEEAMFTAGIELGPRVAGPFRVLANL